MGVKRIDISEFQSSGLLAEANRSFFHPLGLALEIVIDEDGSKRLGGIWDYRDDPEGMLFGEPFPTEQVEKAQKFIRMKHAQRIQTLGFIYQTGGEKDGKNGKADAVDSDAV